ncbi:response regulator, partial [Arthrospira platensis SPKY1]|nr:response regulator [Arthrospira platensis SPKY1]
VVLWLHSHRVIKAGLHQAPNTFVDPTEAMAHIQQNNLADKHFLLFLDINMPLLNAWQFMDELATGDIKAQIQVVIVTSSVDRRDHEKAATYPMVVSFIEKPIESASMDELLLVPQIQQFKALSN